MENDMKTVVMVLLALTLVTSAALAQDSTSAKGPGKDQPCLKIQQACKKAGFVKGGAKEGKGLFVNCVQPILKGKSVPGVTMDAATIQACEDNMEKLAQRNDKNKDGSSKSK